MRAHSSGINDKRIVTGGPGSGRGNGVAGMHSRLAGPERANSVLDCSDEPALQGHRGERDARDPHVRRRPAGRRLGGAGRADGDRHHPADRGRAAGAGRRDGERDRGAAGRLPVHADAVRVRDGHHDQHAVRRGEADGGRADPAGRADVLLRRAGRLLAAAGAGRGGHRAAAHPVEDRPLHRHGERHGDRPGGPGPDLVRPDDDDRHPGRGPVGGREPDRRAGGRQSW